MLTGVFIGLLVGLCLALAVALYLNKFNPFVSRDRAPAQDKREARTDTAKAEPSRSASSKPGLPAPAPPAGMPAPARAQPAQPLKPQEARQADAKRFEFYKILPGTEEAVTDKDLQRSAPQGASRDVYYLQAGAFQKAADADNLKARLALAGLEAQIQTATLPDKSVWHRVRLGPFASAEGMSQARGVLRENKIEPSIIKVAEGGPRP
jgi:cell division protein FtsN